MNRQWYIVAILVLILGMILGWYLVGDSAPDIPFFSKNNTSTPTPTVYDGSQETMMDTSSEGVTEGEGKGGVAERVVVTYSDTGFSPKTITIDSGTTVAFMNDSNTNLLWIISTDYPELDQGRSVSRGGSYEYKFIEKGTWIYTNNMRQDDIGTVVVR